MRLAALIVCLGALSSGQAPGQTAPRAVPVPPPETPVIQPIPPPETPVPPPGDDDPVLRPGGVPPEIAVIEGVRGDSLVVRQTAMLPTTRTRERPVSETITDPDGQRRVVTRTVQETYTVMVPRTMMLQYPLAGVRVFDTNGKAIPTERLARLYARPGLALVANEGVPVDPAYLKIARDGVPLIALPLPPP